jgi:hypothetical protein
MRYLFQNPYQFSRYAPARPEKGVQQGVAGAAALTGTGPNRIKLHQK